MSGAIYGIVRYILAKKTMETTENIIIIILQYILTMFAVITPKSILTKAFRYKITFPELNASHKLYEFTKKYHKTSLIFNL